MLSVEEMDNLWNELANDEILYSGSMEQVVMLFLSKKINNIYQMKSIEEIRSSFINVFSVEVDDDVPHTKQAFFNYIFTFYLELEKAPKDYFVPLALEAAKDIEEINERMNEYNQEINKLDDNKSSESRYTIKQYTYLIDKLWKAKYEIADFIACDLKKLSLKKARDPWLGTLLASYHWDYYYDYRNNKDQYTPLVFSDVVNIRNWADVTTEMYEI